jgi:hypothetical protein
MHRMKEGRVVKKDRTGLQKQIEEQRRRKEL